MTVVMTSVNKKIGEIQSGIPIPPKPGGKASHERKAIEELQPGESRTFGGYTSRKLVMTCGSIRKVYPDRRFVVRSFGEQALWVRVWREK
jgi:hypothetical protein